MPPHVIRLRGPWELRPLEQWIRTVDGPFRLETETLPEPCRVEVPSDWEAQLGPEYRGTVRYTRRFNCPTNLAPAEKVCLAFDGVDHWATVTLNGRPLGEVHGHSQQPTQFEVSAQLALHNMLEVDVVLPPEVWRDPDLRRGRGSLAGGIVGEVRLEIGE
jgi:beta-galactosidase/beta-glucuronidase